MRVMTETRVEWKVCGSPMARITRVKFRGAWNGSVQVTVRPSSRSRSKSGRRPGCTGTVNSFSPFSWKVIVHR